MRVEIKCEGASQLALKDMVHFQNNLKELSQLDYEKFRSKLLELGFSEPFSIWRNEGKCYILNGHQRRITLMRMIEEGIEMPRLFPVNWVQAEDYDQAKRKVLSLASQFGEITFDGLKDFAEQMDVDMNELLEEFRFPEIKPISFDDDLLPDVLPAPDIEGDDDTTGRFVFVYSTEEEKQELMEALGIDGSKIVYELTDLKGECNED